MSLLRSLCRPRLSVFLIAATVFVLPVVAQDLDPCFVDCHQEAKKVFDQIVALGVVDEAHATRAARLHFANCMEENCGGM